MKEFDHFKIRGSACHLTVNEAEESRILEFNIVTCLVLKLQFSNAQGNFLNIELKYNTFEKRKNG